MHPASKMFQLRILQTEMRLVTQLIQRQFLHKNQYLHPCPKEIRFRPTKITINHLVGEIINSRLQISNKVQADHLDPLTEKIEPYDRPIITLLIVPPDYLPIILTRQSPYQLDMNKKLRSKGRYIFFMYQQVKSSCVKKSPELSIYPKRNYHIIT